MLRKVFFRVPRLAVAGVNAAGSGIVHDVRPQGLYLAHTRFRRLYGRLQIIELLLRIGGGIDKCVEIGKAFSSRYISVFAICLSFTTFIA